MLDQEKVGRFIAEQRKNKNMTQKQLAEKLDVSDKAVSKWETGRSLPDNGIILNVCKALDISVNDLLAGEHVTDEAYEEQVQQNVIDLIGYSESKIDDRRYVFMGIIFGGILMLMFFISLGFFISDGMFADIIGFIDFPSLLFILFGTFAVLFLSGRTGDFFRSFAIVFHPKKDYEFKKVNAAFDAVKLASKALLISGILNSIVSFVILFGKGVDSHILLQNIAVAILTIVYALVFIILLLPIETRLKQRIDIAG